MATPYLCKPIEYGADIVTNSTTKFLTGNGTALGGVAVDSGNFDWAQNDKFSLLTEKDPSYHGMSFHERFGKMAFTVRGIAIGLRDLGACQSPFNAFLTLCGIETLGLRMERHCQNAQKVAEFLESHNKVEWVSYPGLPSNKYYEISKKYFSRGTGAVFTFGIKGGLEEGKKVVESVKLISHLANIGDSRTLIIHPASTTHSQLSKEQKECAGASDNVLRISVGLEHIDDILEDLSKSLG